MQTDVLQLVPLNVNGVMSMKNAKKENQTF